MNFTYLVSRKEGLIVVSFKGDLDDSEGLILKKCLAEVVASSPSGVVLHLAEAAIPKEGYRGFSQFLRELKSRCGVVKVSALNTGTVESLIHAGLLSSAETRDALIDALKEVAAQIKANKA